MDGINEGRERFCQTEKRCESERESETDEMTKEMHGVDDAGEWE